MDDFFYGQLRNLPLLERPDEVGHTPALIGAVSEGPLRRLARTPDSLQVGVIASLQDQNADNGDKHQPDECGAVPQREP